MGPFIYSQLFRFILLASRGNPRQARAASKGFQFPAGVVVFKYFGSIGSRDFCFERRGISRPGELHRSDCSQAPVGVEGRPLAQVRRVGKRLPHFFRRVAQFSDENKRPLLSVLLYLRPVSRARYVLLAISHLRNVSLASASAA